MDRLEEAKDLGALVAGLYSAGIQFVVSEDGKRVGAVGNVGPGMKESLKANKAKLLEMLTGDPLSGALAGRVGQLSTGKPSGGSTKGPRKKPRRTSRTPFAVRRWSICSTRSGVTEASRSSGLL